MMMKELEKKREKTKRGREGKKEKKRGTNKREVTKYNNCVSNTTNLINSKNKI